jgi:hypothetical protein
MPLPYDEILVQVVEGFELGHLGHKFCSFGRLARRGQMDLDVFVEVGYFVGTALGGVRVSDYEFFVNSYFLANPLLYWGELLVNFMVEPPVNSES